MSSPLQERQRPLFPRQWGACWVGCQLWDQLKMEEFWRPLLTDSREGTCWYHILQTLTLYRLIDPGSEWRLRRHWFANSAMADLLDEDFSLANKDNFYRCLDKLIEHRQKLFVHLRKRWEDMFEFSKTRDALAILYSAHPGARGFQGYERGLGNQAHFPPGYGPN